MSAFYLFQRKYESMCQYLFTHSNRCLNHVSLVFIFCLAYCNIIQDTWVYSVLETGALFLFILIYYLISMYKTVWLLEVWLNTLTDWKKEVETAFPIFCSLVYLVKSFWVIKVPLTASSFASLWMQILIWKLGQYGLSWVVHKGDEYLITVISWI